MTAVYQSTEQTRKAARQLLGKAVHRNRTVSRKGLLGRLIGVGHAVTKLYGHDMTAMIEARSLEAQRASFRDIVEPLFDKKLVKWVTIRKLSLYGLGIPPQQFEALSGGAPMSEVLRERLRRLACDFPLRENCFACQAFGRSYAPAASGPLPSH